ncbi:sodium- and chloride-dependent glycine transporter 1-like [Haliotis rufescens]|uniref:sodium- and chloride-dependent glycine transporter 1-like n=1 Tax=Haliotis rufescens TaxID=6454 RepID=UPI00201F05B9|nr:sodium- and chloride-dependent glycine transporter 1-like [Haliotis rufescens]
MGHETWGSHVDYIVTILGYSVGVGGMWKFPYLCMRNGGGAFLLLFLVFSVIGAIPCVFLEMVIGQFSQSGPVKVWNLCPPFRGIGLGYVLITMYFSTYYPALFAWFFYYLYYSFSAKIPWAHCDNFWNTPSCISHFDVDDVADANVTNASLTDSNAATAMYNNTVLANGTGNWSGAVSGMTAAEEFWRFRVLEISDGLEHLGEVRWPLFGCLVIAYVMAFLFIFQGIKVSGKVVYLTVGIPYILLTVFLIQGCLLPGSADGIYYFVYPKFEKLLDPKIWIEACNYALYSLGIAWGCLITMASHNKFNNNCFRDVLIIVAADVATAVFVGFAFFAIMGHVAYLRGVTVEAFQSSGFNLGFIVYPEAVASLPVPQLWSALTFITLLLLGIDSLIPCFEISITALTDQFPRLARQRWLPYIMVLLPSLFMGLLYMSRGGIYMLTLVDWYAFFPSMAVFAMLECFVVTWCYGTNRLEKDIKMMWGKTVPKAMIISLKYICPILFLVIFSYSLYSYRPPKYGDYVFPAWATGLGWTISFSSLVPLPVIFFWTVYRTEGKTLKEKVMKALEPNKHWGPSTFEKENCNGEATETMM